VPLYSLTVNGEPVSVDVDGTTPLLYVLMDDLQLNGPKFGCGLAQCGACTVLLDGQPIRSCVRPIMGVAGHDVTTIEGLGTSEKPHPIQAAFIQEQAAQCAFCISGVMLYGKAYIDGHPGATEEEIIQALNGILCRCYTHVRMVKALVRYAQEVQP
jgi:nicotinate dehydrogenase subunit A